MLAPEERRGIVRAVAGVFDLEAGIFEKLLDMREERVKLSREESFDLFKGCLREMRKLSRQVDALGG